MPTAEPRAGDRGRGGNLVVTSRTGRTRQRDRALIPPLCRGCAVRTVERCIFQDPYQRASPGQFFMDFARSHTKAFWRRQAARSGILVLTKYLLEKRVPEEMPMCCRGCRLPARPVSPPAPCRHPTTRAGSNKALVVPAEARGCCPPKGHGHREARQEPRADDRDLGRGQGRDPGRRPGFAAPRRRGRHWSTGRTSPAGEWSRARAAGALAGAPCARQRGDVAEWRLKPRAAARSACASRPAAHRPGHVNVRPPAGMGIPPPDVRKRVTVCLDEARRGVAVVAARQRTTTTTRSGPRCCPAAVARQGPPEPRGRLTWPSWRP